VLEVFVVVEEVVSVLPSPTTPKRIEMAEREAGRGGPL
jgi:hypothetical protein